MMNSHFLKDYDFKISYGPADDRLNSFYIPALSRSIRYDRSAGYFSSSALAVAATGVAHLIKNQGTMRLLVGADLNEQDVEAVQKGHTLSDILKNKFLHYLDDPEELAKQQLEVLAWMVANQTLQIKVVLPQRYGIPIPSSQSLDYYHPKEGIFTDGSGNQIAFSGSVNESAKGWENNYEQFAVYMSWDASEPYLEQVKYRFNRLWDGKEPDWIALPIPDAVKDSLIRFKPYRAPIKDPLEKEIKITGKTDIQEQVIFQFLRDAPCLPNGKYLAEETATVRLWPHQKATVDEISSNYPSRYLLCSEVGLGKTIEAGMALRQLLLSGKVKRCLILTPKSVTRQWQEELYEKMGLNIPLYDGTLFLDYFNNILPNNQGNPWAALPIFIASSQLAKRKERQEELLSAGHWDLVILDEAHHARRKDFLDQRRRPNRLLELLEGTSGLLGLACRTKGLIFLTATPMQVHPVEVWDLLKNLNVGGRWQASDQNFLHFFGEIRKPFDRVDWSFVLSMFEDSLATGTILDSIFSQMAAEKLGMVEWTQIRDLYLSGKRVTVLKQLSPDGQVILTDLVKRHTPLRRVLKRSTRKLLHRYKKLGLLQETVPVRVSRSEWIPMTEEERSLYERIEEYFSNYYEKYENERKGLGFIMTVYRRRLTSSFYAVERSLEKRLNFLKGIADEGLTEEDTEQEELSQDFGEDFDKSEYYSDEMKYLEDFLHDIRQLKNDSKWECLHSQIGETLKKHDTLVIFTHYTDTMDSLREHLRQIYGSQVACYSGRGGEVWNGYTWASRTKEEIKNVFREAKDIKILLCTDAASEGLNLQTCGVLINYDMPWNPMRAEQRIGRIDRIGGHSKVYIYNYFLKDTVEAKVYQALSTRINLFEWVVGELQPILSSVERTIQELALANKVERKTRIEEAIDRLNLEYDEQVSVGLKLDDYLSEDVEKDEGGIPPLTLHDLEETLTRSTFLQSLWKPNATYPNSWILTLEDGATLVTFDRDIFDKYPETLRLLAYGEPLFDQLIYKVQPPQTLERIQRAIIKFSAEIPQNVVSYYYLGEQVPSPIKTLTEIKAILDGPAPKIKLTEDAEKAARQMFESWVEEIRRLTKEQEERQRKSHLLSLEDKGRQLLMQAAICEIAKSQASILWEEEESIVGFDEEAIQRLKKKGFPYSPMFKLLDTKGLKPDPSDSLWLAIQGKSEREIKGHLEYIKRDIKNIVGILAEEKNIVNPPAPKFHINEYRYYG